MMKKIIVCLTAALLVGGTMKVNAQKHSYYDTRHEVGVTIGSGANTQIIGALCDLTEIMVDALITTPLTGGRETAYFTYGDEKYTPAISVEYYYHVNKLIGLGGYVAYNGMTRDMYTNVKNNETGAQTKEKSGEASRHNWSVMPAAKFDWLRKKNIGLYSKVGVGVSIMNEKQESSNLKSDFDDTTVGFNFHVTPIGIEFGSPNWRGFAEVGMGEQGIVLAGLKYKF